MDQPQSQEPPPAPSSSSRPHVTIAEYEQYPADEDHAFRTKIESSYYEGWDNPFRPEGELSHEAEELLRMWKEGKLQNKTAAGADGEDQADQGGGEKQQQNGGAAVVQEANGKSGSASAKVVEVRRETAPAPSSAAKVQMVNVGEGAEAAATATSAAALEDPKKKKQSGCCSVM